MHRLEQHIISLLKQFHNKTWIVACSGGLDSMSLLNMLHSIDYDVRAVHMNYQLRGKESDADALFVEQFCNERSIPFELRQINLQEILDKEGGNLQAKARELRYAWFEELLADKNNCILLGHHADDQVEGFFLNMARDSGVMGLASMPFKRGNIYRPLLQVSKDELAKYATEKKLGWREDVSNSSNKYKRNQLRNEVLPFLYKEIPTLKHSVLTLVKHFQARQNELESDVRPIAESFIDNNHVSVGELTNFDEFQRIEFLRQLRQPASLLHEFSHLLVAQKGKMLPLVPSDHGFTAIVREHNTLTLLRKTSSVIYQLVVEPTESIPNSFTKDELYLDSEKVIGNLQLRKWKMGDRLSPIGMNGSKLVSDIIMEARVPADEKNSIQVLHDDENIHWCIGLKVGRKAIADEHTSTILKCTVTSEVPQLPDHQ